MEIKDQVAFDKLMSRLKSGDWIDRTTIPNDEWNELCLIWGDNYPEYPSDIIETDKTENRWRLVRYAGKTTMTARSKQRKEEK